MGVYDRREVLYDVAFLSASVKRMIRCIAEAKLDRPKR